MAPQHGARAKATSGRQALRVCGTSPSVNGPRSTKPRTSPSQQVIRLRPTRKTTAGRRASGRPARLVHHRVLQTQRAAAACGTIQSSALRCKYPHASCYSARNVPLNWEIWACPIAPFAQLEQAPHCELGRVAGDKEREPLKLSPILAGHVPLTANSLGAMRVRAGLRCGRCSDRPAWHDTVPRRLRQTPALRRRSTAGRLGRYRQTR